MPPCSRGKCVSSVIRYHALASCVAEIRRCCSPAIWRSPTRISPMNCGLSGWQGRRKAALALAVRPRARWLTGLRRIVAMKVTRCALNASSVRSRSKAGANGWLNLCCRTVSVRNIRLRPVDRWRLRYRRSRRCLHRRVITRCGSSGWQVKPRLAMVRIAKRSTLK